ncbi:MAG TPA: glycosyltransferase family 9 protein [Candidatus Sulfotelmatobacter sp.]|nr:glycosyltransferase family 9 protein [Candidatus Sulfotelmatobacter sp.]
MRKLLIVKLGAIGDVLRTTALLPGLTKLHEPAVIDWLTAAGARELLDNNPYLRQVFTWGETEITDAYDLVIGLEDDREVCRFVSRVETSERRGAYLAAGKVVYTPSAWFDMSIISKYGLDKANQLKAANRKTYQQHMADLLGIAVSPYVFKLTPDEIAYGQKIVRDLGFAKNDRVIGINTGAGKRWPLKSWGVEQTIELVKKLKDDLGLPSIILGGGDERERNKLIARETGMPDGGVHTLRGFAGIVNRCAALLASDSLALHFGIALKKPLVVFFGPTSAAEIELYGLGEKLTAPLPCVTCYKKQCETEPSCMDSLRVETVFDAIKRQLNSRY